MTKRESSPRGGVRLPGDQRQHPGRVVHPEAVSVARPVDRRPAAREHDRGPGRLLGGRGRSGLAGVGDGVGVGTGVAGAGIGVAGAGVARAPRSRLGRRERGAQLEEPHVARSPGHVAFHVAEQAGEQVPTQSALLIRDGVEHGHVAVGHGREGRGLGLADPVGDERRPQRVLQTKEGVVWDRSGSIRTQGLGEGVVAVGAGDFLDQVDLAKRVPASVARNAEAERALLAGRWSVADGRAVVWSVADGHPVVQRVADGRAVGRCVGRPVPGVRPVPFGHGVAQRRQQAGDLVRLEADPQDPAHPRRAELHDGGPPRRRTGVDHLAARGAAGHRRDQGGGPVHGGLHRLRIDAPFEAVAGVGGHSQGSTSRPYPPGLEEGALQQHVGGSGRDLRGGAAHHARHGHRVRGVADRQHLGREGAVLAVQGDQGLARPGLPHDHRRALQLGQVEGVKGLAQLQHRVVGGVHDVVHGAGAHGPQPVRQPEGRRADRDSTNHRAQVAGTEFRVLDRDGDAGRLGFGAAPGEGGRDGVRVHGTAGERPGVGVLAGARPTAALRRIEARPGVGVGVSAGARAGRGERGQRNGGLPAGVKLPGDADVREQVAPVGRDLHVEAEVVQPHRLHEGRAGVEVAVQQHDAGMVGTQSQLSFGAQHAFAALSSDLPPADLEAAGQRRAHGSEGVEGAGAHVGRAAHHRHLAGRPRDPAERQAVGARVGSGLQHFADRHVAQARREVHHLFHGRAPQRQALDRLFRREADPRRQLPKPAVRDLHEAAALRLADATARAGGAAQWPGETFSTADDPPAGATARAAALMRTAPGSACRSRRRAAGRGPRGGASRSAPVPCRTPTRHSAPGRSPRSPARPDRPFPRP